LPKEKAFFITDFGAVPNDTKIDNAPESTPALTHARKAAAVLPW
jgi:hypothetical protein